MDVFTPRAVVVPDDAAPAARTAAAELSSALARSGWGPLPVLSPAEQPPAPAFFLGEPPPGGVGADPVDGCRAAFRGDRLHLWGQGPRGTLYAVYGYLQDHLGFRWLTRDVERRPALHPDSTLPAPDFEQRPAFPVRDVGYFEAMQAPWNARLRLNGEFSARTLGAEWGGGTRYTHYVHTFYQLVPPERHFARHPEYFSLVDGRRQAAFAQLCLTQPDIVDIAASEVCEWFQSDPAARIASVSQNDWLGACECASCRALVEREGSQAGPVLHFVNAVARAVARRFPDRLIDTLAYWYSEDAPRHVRPEPNVVVRLCHMSPSCESHAIEACPHNDQFAARLEAWSRIAPRLHVWDYDTNFSHYLMPFPNFSAIAQDLRLFRKRGVESMFCQGDLEDGGGGEWSELRAYYLARLLWNPHEDPEALVTEFVRGVFPHAAAPMRAYFDRIQAQARDPGRHLRMFSPVQSGHLTSEVVGQALRSLTEAAASAAAGDAAEQSQVRRAQLAIDYARLAMPPAFTVEGDAIRPSAPAGAGGAADAAGTDAFLPPEQRRAALAEFLAELGRQGIRRVREATPLDTFRRRVAVLASPHAAPVWAAGGWRLRIVPDLGGRLWEAAYDGHSLLCPPEPADADYPASRGYAEAVAGDIGPAAPFELTPLEGAAADGGCVELTATLDGMSAWHPYAGIRVRREMTADPRGALGLHTVAANRDTSSHPLQIRPLLCLLNASAPVEALDAQGDWTVRAEPEPGRPLVLHGTCGWRIRVGAQVFQCLHDAVDRVQIEAHAWGWRIECVGPRHVVPPGGAVGMQQRWRLFEAAGAGARATT